MNPAIPVALKLVALDPDGGEVFAGHAQALGLLGFVEFCANGQTASIMVLAMSSG
jgi:hypothetical protein